MPTPTTRALEKALDLMSAIIRAEDGTSLASLAEALGLPLSTAYRFAGDLKRRGLIVKTGGGGYAAGQHFFSLARGASESRTLAHLARPIMRRLAARSGCTVQMGVLEDGMVTYLVKEAGGPAAAFTREGMQLEAYCSGIGKVLLAHADPAVRNAYLADGPFVPLTPNTIVDPEHLRDQLVEILDRGWAMDDAEIFEHLRCLAVPIRGADGCVVAALSISTLTAELEEASRARFLSWLTRAVGEMEARASGGQSTHDKALARHSD